VASYRGGINGLMAELIGACSKHKGQFPWGKRADEVIEMLRRYIK
jgi:hypothetical protein